MNKLVSAAGPDFMCVGAQKAGTGWLYDQLSAHPRIWMPPIKELHFFTNLQESNWRFFVQAPALRSGELGPGHRNFRYIFAESPTRTAADRVFLDQAVTYNPKTSDFDWYAGLFAGSGEFLSGEITPAYSTLTADIVSRIAHRFPSLKIIFLARDPVDRFWSAANMLARRSKRKPGATPIDLTNWDSIQHYLRTPHTMGRSLPSATLRTWAANFPKESLFVGLFDELVCDPTQLRARICRFLGVDAPSGEGTLPAEFNRKASGKKTPMSDEIRRNLIDCFRDEYAEAAALLGGPAKTWMATQLQRIAQVPAGT